MANQRIQRRVVRRSSGTDIRKPAPARTNAERYGFRVAWQPSEDAFVATCLEFPSVRARAASATSALEGAQQQVAEAITHAQQEGQDVPEPLATRTFSGKLQVRLGEDLHRALAEQAADNGMSLNQLIVKKLSAG